MANRAEPPSFTLAAAQVAEFELLYPGDLQRGYRCGLIGEPLPSRASPAFEHGRQCGVNDIGQGRPGDWEKRMRARDVMTPPWVQDALTSRYD